MSSDERSSIHQPYVVAIPLFKPRTLLPSLIAALSEQVPVPSAWVFLDSSPPGERASRSEFAALSGTLIVETIDKFDHGETRNVALAEAAHHADICIFLTQDALPTDPESLPRLAAEIRGNVWAASGRQLPRSAADPIEVVQRERRYPAGPARRPLSNAFAAYRVGQFRDLGGFRHPCVWGEDFIATADIEANGGTVSYCPEATVRHSHAFSPASDIRRYFDAGAARRQSRQITAGASLASNEGLAALRGDVLEFLPRRPGLALKTIARFGVRSVGYLIGRIHPALPHKVVLGLTSNKAYWRESFASKASDD